MAKTPPFKIFILCFLGVSLMGCQDHKIFKNIDDLTVYVQDEQNGYKQKKIVYGFEFSLMYRPTDLLVYQEIGSKKINSKQLNKLRNKYADFMYYNLSISKNNKELLSTIPKNRNEFGTMVNQLNFGMREKVHLMTQNKDTIELIDFMYPRMFGMSRSTTLMFVFPRKDYSLENEYLTLIIEDLGIHTGQVKFQIPSKKIKNEPQLNFLQ